MSWHSTISVKENERLSSQNFGLLEFTFENITDEWIRIKTCKIGFGSDEIEKNITLTSGEDLVVWNKAVEQIASISDYNTTLVLGTISALGTTISATSRNNSVKNVSGTIGLTALSSLAVNELNKIRDNIQSGDIFPENHLYSKGFNIPPGLFVKRWVLLNSKNHPKIGRIENIILEYETHNNKKEKIAVNVRQPNSNRTSLWQSDVIDNDLQYKK